MQLNSALIGMLLGVGIATGGYAIRMNVRSGTIAMGSMGGLASIVIVGFLMTIGLRTGSGGDAGMAAVTLLVLGLVGGLIAILLALAIGALQRIRLSSSLFMVSLALFCELLLIGIIAVQYRQKVYEPAEAAITNKWWELDAERRQQEVSSRTGNLQTYSGIPPSQIMQYTEARRRAAMNGSPPPPMPIPLPVAGNNVPTVPVQQIARPNYDLIKSKRSSFLWSLALSWILTALGLPVMWRSSKSI